MSDTTTTPAGWYPDPSGGPGQQRWWDGAGWTDRTQVAGPAPTSTAPGGQPAFAPAAPGKKKAKWPWILGGVLLAMLLGLGGCVALIGSAANEVAEDIEQKDAEAMAEVSIDSCQPGQFAAEVKGKATNGTSQRSDYFIEVRLLDAAGTTLDTGYATIANVDPGTTSEWTTSAMFNADQSRLADCEVVDVTRTASQP